MLDIDRPKLRPVAACGIGPVHISEMNPLPHRSRFGVTVRLDESREQPSVFEAGNVYDGRGHHSSY